MRTYLKFKIFLLSVLFFLSYHSPVLASDDFQYWSRFTLKTWERERWNLSTYGDFRLMEDASDPKLYLISEKLGYRWLEILDLGVNYTYIESEATLASGEEEFKYQHRLELEANPKWHVDGWLKIKNRNRIEFRWIEDKGSDNTRFRQLWEMTFPLEDPLPIEAFYLNNEYFFDFNRSQINENRLIPAGIAIRINDQTSVKVFYMIQSKKGAVDWSSNQVIGTHITISF